MSGPDKDTRVRLERSLRTQSAFLTLTRNPVLLGEDLEAAFREITRFCAETLELDRVGLWRFTPDRSAIRCESLYRRNKETHGCGELLPLSANPAYFSSLAQSELVAVEDATADPRTAGFDQTVSSTMDAPVFVSGSLQGVLRCESVDRRRPWNQDERTFAVAVANLVAGILAHVRTRDAERTLRDFLENANDMVVFLTPEGRYEYVNQTWCDAIGYTPEEARSLTWPQIIAPEALPALQSVWRRILSGDDVGRIEVPKLTKDGRRVDTVGSLRAKIVNGVPVSVRGIFQNVTQQRRMEEALQRSEDRRHLAEETARSRSRFELLVGHSEAMQEVFRRLRLAAQSDVTVLLTGESGTGKELAASAVHSLSGRRAHPFVAVNCSAIPEPLLESELFGHVKGAFTGAVRDKPGLFQVAEGGTLFLDEVAEMSAALQVKVLRALQEHEIRRVGDERSIKVDARIITATNRDLKVLLDQGKLRPDFYYRIAVYPITMPTLRDRRDDIPLLVDHFVSEIAGRQGIPPPKVTTDALRAMMEYSWPGNVRELRNSIEHAFVTRDGDLLTLADFPPEIRSQPVGAEPDVLEERRILEALGRSKGNRSKAARALGMSRVTLWKRLQKLGLVKHKQ
ncbi:MAG TPA: sigma 54-interacting transcriptional regulator [Planctomycetota bacterium]|nr:sigma 54-interacting transcriptional regulator [Planctomycetota bacterium]